MVTPPPPQSIHATSVALDGRALLLLGPSGAGKSALALRMMALGATLIADDITLLTPEQGRLVASCPPGGEGRIEARGVGILAAPVHPSCPVALAADLGQRAVERLPPRRSVTLCGVDIAVVHDPGMGDFATTLHHYLRFGRLD